MAKESTCSYLTDCINVAICNRSFPDELNKADVSAIFKKDDPSWKGNGSPISYFNTSFQNIWTKYGSANKESLK